MLDKIVSLVPAIIGLMKKAKPKNSASLVAASIGTIVATQEVLPNPISDLEIILKYSVEIIAGLTALIGTLATFMKEQKGNVEEDRKPS